MEAEANHSKMVKFSNRGTGDYTKALDSLYRFEKEAGAVVERQFRSGTWYLVHFSSRSMLRIADDSPWSQ